MNYNHIARFFRKNEEIKIEKNFYLFPSTVKLSQSVILGEGDVMTKVDPSYILPKNVSHHLQFSCSKMENLLSSSTEVEVMYFTLSESDSQTIIKTISLDVNQLEECGSICYPLMFNNERVNSTSFIFDYLPALHQKLPSNMLLKLKISYSCSPEIQDDKLVDALNNEEDEIETIKNTLKEDEKVINEDKHLIETLMEEIKILKKK